MSSDEITWQNVIVGTLSDGPSKIFLLTTKVLEKINYSIITKLFERKWPGGIRHNNYFCPMQHFT